MCSSDLKINHKLDENTLYMKVAQNDETNPNTQPVRPPRVPSIANLQHFTSGSSVRKCKTPGILSRMFPPFIGITYYRVRAHLAPLIVMSCIVMLMFALYLSFLPPFLYGRLRDRRCYCPFDYGVDDPSFLPEQPGKPHPLITRYHLFFSLLLALE